MEIFAYNLAMHLLNKFLPAGDLMAYMIKNGIHLNEFDQIIIKIRNLINKNSSIAPNLTRLEFLRETVPYTFGDYTFLW